MSSTHRAPTGLQDQRPEFMAVLGLLPPYTLDDVKRAYLDKVQAAHPDHGGTIARFRAIQDAYEEAQRYLQFRSDKRTWIAAQMDRYTAYLRLEEQLRKHGADVQAQQADWLKKSYGDFSELTTSLEAIKLTDSLVGNDVVELLVANHSAVSGLKRLELPGCGLTDQTALRLSCFQALQYLDLSRNELTGEITQLASLIPTLSVFQLDGTSVGIWNKIKLARRLRKRSAA